MKKLTLRPAIAMIELIFALTVMGIVMLSIPNLLGMASGSTYTSLQQEAIATASSDISLIMGREWDHGDTNQDHGEPILDVGNADGDIGVANDNYIRTTSTNNGATALEATKPVDLGKEDGIADDSNDIDDANGDTVQLISSTTTKSGNIDTTIRITSRVYYISDSETTGTAGNWDDSTVVSYNYPFTDPDPDPAPDPQTSSTNIKHISVNLTSNTGMDELNKNIILFAFSCNIGGFKRERRVFE